MRINSFQAVSNVKGNHLHQGIWAPNIDEILSIEREPGNPKERKIRCLCKEK